MPVTAVKDKDQPERSNLRQKLVAVMGDMERVEKRGFNQAQNYKFARAEDIVDVVRKAFAAHGIAFLSNEEKIESLPDFQTKSGATMSVVRITMRYTLMDTDSDEQLTAVGTGEGQDTGDKHLNKAKTAAMKYFLQQTLLISTGDDPEDDKGGAEDQVRTQPQGRREDLPCPKCGNVGSWILKRDGMWSCWGSKGGCEFKCSNDEYLKLTAPKVTSKPAPRGPQPINEPPMDEEFEEPAARVDANGGRITERVVAAPDLVQQIETLIAKADNPAATRQALYKQCAVGDLSDLTPEQAQWAVDVMQAKLQRKQNGQQEEGNGKRQPRR